MIKCSVLKYKSIPQNNLGSPCNLCEKCESLLKLFYIADACILLITVSFLYISILLLSSIRWMNYTNAIRSINTVEKIKATLFSQTTKSLLSSSNSIVSVHLNGHAFMTNVPTRGCICKYICCGFEIKPGERTVDGRQKGLRNGARYIDLAVLREAKSAVVRVEHVTEKPAGHAGISIKQRWQPRSYFTDDRKKGIRKEDSWPTLAPLARFYSF